MRAKDYLLKIEKLDILIKNKQLEKQQERQRWEDIALGITAQMGTERVQTSGNKQRMAAAVGMYIDAEKEIDERITALRREREGIIATIEQLPAKDYEFLHMVYVQHYTLKEVAALKKNSYSWATSAHGHALQKVQLIIDRRNC